MNQRYRLLALLFFLAIGALLLLGNPTGTSWAAPHTPDDIDIVGGAPVPDPNPFVWQVKLYMTRADGKQAGCGGSVISERWILTAAHCVVMDSPVTEVDVVVGQRILDLSHSSAIFAVRRAEPHPYYDDVLLSIPSPIYRIATSKRNGLNTPEAQLERCMGFARANLNGSQ